MYSKIKSMMACDAWRGVWCGVCAYFRILGLTSRTITLL